MRIAPACAVFLLAASIPGPAAAQEPQSKMILLDQKYDANTWVNRDGEIYLAVSVFLTRGSDKLAYIPLEVVVANPTSRTIVLTRDSFTLIDRDGNAYPVTPPKEIRKNYGRLTFDRSKALLSHVMMPVFQGFKMARSQFEPNPRMTQGESNVIQDRVELPTFFAMTDILYFKMPATGLRGTYFELRVSVPGMEEPLSIKFAVDLPKSKDEE